MKRLLVLFLTVAVVLSVTGPALAKWGDGGHGDRQGQHDRVDRDDRDHHGDRDGHDRLPFKWRDHHRTFDRHHMERIHDIDIERHHPGLHAYRWYARGDYGDGFWHHGRHIRDAILFFNDDDEFVAFGYMNGGVFVYVREDGYEDRDPFFFIRWFGR